MQRHADAREGCFERDRLALGVADVQQDAGLLVPQRLGDVVDQVVVLLILS